MSVKIGYVASCQEMTVPVNVRIPTSDSCVCGHREGVVMGVGTIPLPHLRCGGHFPAINNEISCNGFGFFGKDGNLMYTKGTDSVSVWDLTTVLQSQYLFLARGLSLCDGLVSFLQSQFLFLARGLSLCEGVDSQALT
mgnify:CR=1 FL=1